MMLCRNENSHEMVKSEHYEPKVIKVKHLGGRGTVVWRFRPMMNMKTVLKPVSLAIVDDGFGQTVGWIWTDIARVPGPLYVRWMDLDRQARVPGFEKA